MAETVSYKALCRAGASVRGTPKATSTADLRQTNTLRVHLSSQQIKRHSIFLYGYEYISLSSLVTSDLDTNMDIPSGVNLNQVPGLAPPPGVMPNFANPPESYQNTIVATLVVCQTLATLVVAVRGLSLILRMKSFGWEDCEP